MAQDAEGKGLDELSDPEASENAEAAADEADSQEADSQMEDEADAETTATLPARTVTEKMYLATSVGWVSASRSEGEWKSAGMTDVTFGYLLPVAMGKASLYGTYRYAPIVVAGEIDGNSYRGVWDIHYFGALGAFDMGSFDVIGTAELGYALVYLDSVDGLEVDSDHEENGVSFVIGAGADWELLEDKGFKVGPRLNAGFGGFTTVQFGAHATYMF
jgi:hypothetical protein